MLRKTNYLLLADREKQVKNVDVKQLNKVTSNMPYSFFFHKRCLFYTNIQMSIITAFLSLIVCVVGYYQDNIFSTSPHIAETLQTLCPGTNDCSRNQTSEELSEFRKKSCCTGKISFSIYKCH